MSSESIPVWVGEARKFPLAFSQVREDPLIDLEVVENLGEEIEVAIPKPREHSVRTSSEFQEQRAMVWERLQAAA